jgi:putative sterol carrier protein
MRSSFYRREETTEQALRKNAALVYGAVMNDLSVADFTRGMQKLVSDHSQLETRIKIVLEDEGVIFIDGRSNPNSVSNEDEEADVTLSMSLNTLNRLYRRELNPAVAAMTGKIRIDGNVLDALKLEAVLRPFAEG